MTIIEKIIEQMGKEDAHFALAVGSNNDWIAFISKDSDPEGDYGYGTGDTALEAIEEMLDEGSF